ncbi:enolase C-terminal domain-like protein [Tuwongella immobilis]|uniref:Mandelate racemase/muconate lactonizing enzyme C-terminal domain-containing protein n=1 Tax=Tuwongella immobilis TaxID=692036 RepID=A0A6C2YWF3_9BACT|nr:enolase C-terminal domain-like protein [Tuwongella immobilis]VIP05483.1 mandelate racemase muconate lactonizing enzyme family protein : Mandelate racemase/muconate lactonizing protein OS=Planctomyces limnophilus (strain ATCC 43296 / DSM 3776 / IFAM 1008 / 290) GN=Plim_2715 PE=4 SV=1: MR_MLE_C [Tuwongella immobilis]VTS08322.1 mandelate racemase muconate lactonizing enzyme family protein : Mandelate racemase/muconate lactonizing protein OS=Planctomyces limnophilus (strain ATCC 43296 / DSM 3776 /
MKIAALTVHAIRVPLKRKIRHASHTRTDTDNLIVACQLENGIIGYGEGVPRSYVTGETVDGAIDLLKRSNIPAQVEPCTSMGTLLAMAERLTLAPVPNDSRGIAGNAARCAVEMAILDAYLRHFREPLTKIMLRLGGELYQPRGTVQYSGALTSSKKWKLRILTWAMRLNAFPSVKVKVGVSGEDDLWKLRFIRKRLKPTVALRTDANEAYTPENAAEKIRQLEPFGIRSIEQPLPQSQNAALPELRRSIQTPIMLDESLCGRIDAEEAIANGWCDLFNLRISKCGGLIPTLRLAQLAAAAGIGCQLGCQVGETGILSAAGRAFATSIGGLRDIEGSFDRYLLKQNIIRESITFGRRGKAPQLLGHGLGVTVLPKRLAALTFRTESLHG